MKSSGAANVQDLLVHAGWLRRFAVALVRDADAAEDIVQETLIVAWGRPAESSGRPWLARVARNLAIDGWRGSERRRRREAAAAPELDSVRDPEELVGDREIHRAVAEAVAELEEPFRRTLVLRFFDGVASANIARGLGLPEGTVRWRLKEGIERVRRRLDLRYGESRKTWVGALAPLLPRPTAPPSRADRAAPRGRQATGRRFPLHPFTAGSALVLLAGMVLLAMVTVSRSHRSSRVAAGRATSAPSRAVPVGPSGRGSPVRLDLRSLAQASEPPASPPGIGEADARSLFRELVEAIKTGAYDDFVAKGSAAFKAHARAEAVRRANTSMGPRLAAGYQPSLLGQLRRGEHKLWVFRIEFTDGGDDALAFMTTEGWLVAALLFPDPNP